MSNTALLLGAFAAICLTGFLLGRLLDRRVEGLSAAPDGGTPALETDKDFGLASALAPVLSNGSDGGSSSHD